MSGLVRLVILSSVIAGPSDDAEIDTASLFDAAVRSAGYAIGIELVPRARILADHFEDDLRACAGEVSCMARRARAADAALVLVVVAETRTSPAVITAELVDAEVSEVIERKLVELDVSMPKRKALDAALAKLAAVLFSKSGHPIGGRLIVEPTPADATIALDPEARANALAMNTFTLAPGTYRVTAKKPGYEDAIARASVVPASDVRVPIQLEETTSIIRSPWLWMAVGSAVVGTATAFVIAGAHDRRICVSSNLSSPSCP